MERNGPALIRSTWVIINPAAGRGKVAANLPLVRSAFSVLGVRNIYESAAAGDEERLAGRALDQGATTIVAVGGDGTCSRIANVILQSRAQCSLTVVPTGTGNDFAKTLGVNRYRPAQLAHLALRGDAVPIDVGLANGHYFLNSCGFGFDAAVLEASNRVRFLKGDAVYIYSALTKLFTYSGMRVVTRGVPGVGDGAMLMVTLSNGRFLGGAFRIAPTASVLDGRLDACFFRDVGVVERVRLFAGAMRGTHVGMRAVSSARVVTLTLTFEANPAIEIDGELRTADSKSVEVRCVPNALSVLAAPGALV
jgi:diacylglycerol kinase (ATP)